MDKEIGGTVLFRGKSCCYHETKIFTRQKETLKSVEEKHKTNLN